MQAKTSIAKLHDFYNLVPNAPIYKKEFGFYVLDRWVSEGYLLPRDKAADYDAYLREIFGLDEPAIFSAGDLGWCEASFFPHFETKLLEDRGEHELVQDYAGRAVLYFKGRRSGFMPEYVGHPVKDRKTWENDVKWRLCPDTPERLEAARLTAGRAKKAAESGKILVQQAIGGYMYLRSLIGPSDLLYLFYDDPELIHSCMETWFALSDRIIALHQQEVSFDELFLAEDICYNHGALISPDMMREFLLPYYQQLYQNMKARNKGKKLHLQIDTDGHPHDVIDLYRGIGMDYMSPFEAAAGCDIVDLAYRYPDLLVSGGIDKRMIAQGGDPLKKYLDGLMPPMRKRGGFIPTCDHGVPEETSFENYMLYRSLMNDYCG